MTTRRDIVLTDTINELTAANGVSIEGVVVRDSYIELSELSADPSAPGDGLARIWLGDGTGTGEDGDIMCTVNTAASTVTRTLLPKTSFKTASRSTASDLNWNGTTVINLTSISLEAGTWLITAQTAFTSSTTATTSYMYISDVSASSSTYITGTQGYNFISTGSRQQYATSTVVQPSSTTTYYFNAKLNSAGAGVCIDYSLGTGIADPDAQPHMTATRLA